MLLSVPSYGGSEPHVSWQLGISQIYQTLAAMISVKRDSEGLAQPIRPDELRLSGYIDLSKINWLIPKSIEEYIREQNPCTIILDPDQSVQIIQSGVSSSAVFTLLSKDPITNYPNEFSCSFYSKDEPRIEQECSNLGPEDQVVELRLTMVTGNWLGQEHQLQVFKYEDGSVGFEGKVSRGVTLPLMAVLSDDSSLTRSIVKCEVHEKLNSPTVENAYE